MLTVLVHLLVILSPLCWLLNFWFSPMQNLIKYSLRVITLFRHKLLLLIRFTWTLSPFLEQKWTTLEYLIMLILKINGNIVCVYITFFFSKVEEERSKIWSSEESCLQKLFFIVELLLRYSFSVVVVLHSICFPPVHVWDPIETFSRILIILR